MHVLSLILAWVVLSAAVLAAMVWAIDRALRLIGLGGLVFAMIREACRKDHPDWWIRAMEGLYRQE
jgi:hypothetical protein